MSGWTSSSVRAVAAAAIAALLLPTAALAADDESSAASRWNHYALVGFDAAILRPVGFVTLVVGALYVVPVAVFTWPGGRATTDRAVERFVTTPAQGVFQKPLGEL